MLQQFEICKEYSIFSPKITILLRKYGKSVYV